MTLTLTLAPELESRLRREAARHGLPPEQCALKALDEHIPAETQVADDVQARAARVAALFKQWNEEVVDESEALDDDFFRHLDENRPAGAKLFPPELKGITW